MKRTIVIIVMCVAGFASQAQFNHAFVRAGYLMGNTKMDNYRYSASLVNGSPEFSNFQEGHLVNRHVPIELEGYSENFLFTMGFALKPKKWVKEHEKSPGLSGTDGTGFSMKLAFGGYFSDNIGLFLGAQYQWNPTEIVNDNVIAAANSSKNFDYNSFTNTSHNVMGTDFYHDFNGGNQKGFNANLMIAGGNRTLIRLTAMYDWVIRRTMKGGGEFSPWNIKGNAMTGEAAIYFMFDEDEDIGISLNASYSIRNTQLEQIENTDVPEINFDPGMTMTGLNFSVNLLLPASMFASQRYTTTTVRVIG